MNMGCGAGRGWCVTVTFNPAPQTGVEVAGDWDADAETFGFADARPTLYFAGKAVEAIFEDALSALSLSLLAVGVLETMFILTASMASSIES